MTTPKLEEWKAKLQADLEKFGNKKDDLEQVIDLCDNYSQKIGEVSKWLSENQTFVNQIQSYYRELHRIRFPDLGQEPQAQQVMLEGHQSLELNTPEKRRETVLEVLAEMNISPDSSISASAINAEIVKRGFSQIGVNPNGIISSILYRLKEYEKVGNGVFRRITL